MRRDTLEPQPVLEFALSWLKRHLPPPPRRLVLVHGDYRTGNFLYDQTGITGILDWEMAHAGDPIEDLGWLVIKSWRWAGDERVGGLCTRDEFVKLYEDAGGVKVDPAVLKFWEVFFQRQVRHHLHHRHEVGRRGQDARPAAHADGVRQPGHRGRAAGVDPMRPYPEEVLRAIQSGVMAHFAPELTTPYAQAQFAFSMILFAIVQRDYDTAVPDLVDANTALRDLLASAATAIASLDRDDARAARDAVAALPPPAAALRLSALRAENEALREAVCKLTPLVEPAADVPELAPLKSVREQLFTWLSA